VGDDQLRTSNTIARSFGPALGSGRSPGRVLPVLDIYCVQRDPVHDIGVKLDRVVAAELVADGVRVGHATGTVVLHAEWLRDNCPCDGCRITQTDERRHQPWLGAPPVVDTVDLVGEILVVIWRDGHRSVYDPEYFRTIQHAIAREVPEPVPWGSGHVVQRIDHDAVLADSVSRRHLFESFLRDGAVVLTGAPQRPGAVVDLLAALGIPLRELSLGRVFDVLVDPAGYNVAYTAEEIPPHNDNAQATHPPSGQVLAMVVNEAAGGDTVLVDGWSVLGRLERDAPAAVDVLARVAIGFRQYSAEAEGFTRMPIVTRAVNRRFTHLRFSNQLRQPLPFDHPDLAAWYTAYRALGQLVVDRSQQLRFRLEGGQMLIVDGRRVLHGRTAFSRDGRRHLQDVYFDVDDVVGNLARLTGAAKNAMVAR
jgi:gamma-butyrobetaine dioxygenase